MLKRLSESLRHLKQIADRPFFAYATTILLQLKVVWRIWDYKDMTSGDTSSYFSIAYQWFTEFSNNIIWSPLYTSFFGSFLHITSDVYMATILHRIVIVLTVTILVLALMRRLLPPGIAWVIAAWWAILPINFDTLYEVHLFSVIPILLACLIITQRPTSLVRGVAVAILASASILVRNEFSLIAFASTLMCLGWEVWQYWKLGNRHPAKHYVLSYGLPMVAAGALVLAFYNQSFIQFPELPEASAPKHTLNICQVYAFGYQQRYPGEWTGSPWTGCQELMSQQFGQDEPSLFQALVANPPAVLEHFRWNTSLTLNGVQVSLFNATSGSVNPDYASVVLNAYWILLPTLLVGSLSIVGIVTIIRHRRFWWNFWLKERALTWLVLTSAASVAFFVVIPMQRPRPSYLFSLALFLMAVTGMGFFAITRDRPKFAFLSRTLPILIAGLLLFIQPHYPNDHGNRPLMTLYQRFLPFQVEIANQDTVFLSREYSFELSRYLMNPEICQFYSYANPEFWSSLSSQRPIDVLLDEMGINLFYVDHPLLTEFKDDPRAAEFLTNPTDFNWKILAMQDSSNDKWMLLQRLSKD